MNKLLKNSLAVGAVAILLVAPMMASAQISDPTDIIGVTEVTDVCGVIDLIKTIANWMLVFLVVLAVIFVIMAAFKYLGAGGDSEKVGAANKQIIYAAVAVAVGLLAKAVPFVVASLLGTSADVC